MPSRKRPVGGNGIELFWCRPADEKHWFTFENDSSNSGDIGRRFARTENYLGKTTAPAAIDIDPREAEIDESFLSHYDSPLCGSFERMSRIGIILDSKKPRCLKKRWPCSFNRSVSKVIRRKSFFFA